MTPDAGTIEILSGKFIIGILIFIRVTGLFVSAPFFRSSAINPMLKVMLAVIVALSIAEVYWTTQPVVEFHLWNMVFLVFKEFFVGVVIGFSANTVFWAARFAGGLIDFDMGYQTAMLFNMDESSPTLVGELFDIVTLMLFLLINGHHFLLESIGASLKAVPINSFAVTESTVNVLIRLATTVLIIGIKIASPVLAALFLTNLALSLLARIAPQTNVFMISFQAKIAVGLVVMLVTAPLFIYVAKFSLQTLQHDVLDVLLTIKPVKI